jgi:hypothetical protein
MPYFVTCISDSAVSSRNHRYQDPYMQPSDVPHHPVNSVS